jgi:hypothetical protein
MFGSSMRGSAKQKNPTTGLIGCKAGRRARAPSKFFNSSIIKESEKALAFFIDAC